MQPLKKFTGYGFPISVLIFKNKIVTWCLKEKEFNKLGTKLLAIYKDKNKEQEMSSELAKRLDRLTKIEEEIGNLEALNLSDKLLTDIYYKLHDAFINYYGIGAIQEPLAMQAEEKLKEISNLNHEDIALLVASDKLSFIQEAENYLFETKNIDEFIKKYYWIDNNYSKTNVLSKEDAEKRVAGIKPTKLSAVKSSNINLSTEARRLIELLRHFASYQDDRKRNILIYLHHLEILLKEIGKRGNISLELMRDTFPHEIKDILNGKITEEAISKRREKCFVVWKEKSRKPTILMGEETKEWEKLLTPKINKSQIVKGKCASKGKVTGKVRLLLNASENDKLKTGEVLVTFMTSPDFMSAIRKSCAIVTNLGGITSHAAIISRELGIPCIVGTKNATEILKTGDMVEVDANKGIVRIIK
ncbi:MAG: PEP-utilizing enzyme [bacterium]|nr:PEP-utilizing enzyme [bacterium]